MREYWVTIRQNQIAHRCIKDQTFVTMRLTVTVGWSIPVGVQFWLLVGAVDDDSVLSSIYHMADTLNKIGFLSAIWLSCILP